MAQQSVHISLVPANVRQQLDTFFSAMGQGFNAYLERRSRIDEIARLNAKSDAELARIGIRRENIPAYVFRDMFYI